MQEQGGRGRDWHSVARGLDDVQVMLNAAWVAIERRDMKQAVVSLMQAWSALSRLKVELVPEPET